MKPIRIAVACAVLLVSGYLVAPAEAQGRFWILVNGALRYNGSVGLPLTKLSGSTDGVLLLTNAAGTGFSRLQFGGTTSSFPSLKMSGSSLQVKLADDSAFASMSATSFFLQGTGVFGMGASTIISAVAPTIASGGCTSPAVTDNNGTAAFLLTLGSSCTGTKTITLTMPSAPHFWACQAENNTSDAQQAANYIISRGTSTTAVVLTNYARTTGLQADFTAADTVAVQCMAH